VSKISATILIVDDDPDVVNAARVVLRQKFATILTETRPDRIESILKGQPVDVVLLDMNFSAGVNTGNEGLFWLKKILSMNSRLPVLMITAYGEIALAVEAMKSGAADFVVKPWDNEHLEKVVLAAINKARGTRADTAQKNTPPSTVIIGNSPLMLATLRTVDKIAGTDANVLLLGENGTGKEQFARLIHEKSQRSLRQFIKVDVGSLSSTLFESELFGHKKGSFTDAREDRAGHFERANGGTLFIDEIGNIPIELQSKLLSVLQSREVFPIGSNRAVPVDVRLIAATNIPISEAIKAGEFREDLYYRINTVELTLPPLRNRREDIPTLARHFVDLYAGKYHKSKMSLTEAALKKLTQHHWPGNVRELQHAVERAVIMSDSVILSEKNFVFSSNDSIQSSSGKLEEMEKHAIINAIRKYDGNMSKVAKELGLGRTTLYRKMAKFGLDKS
jgi:two-component system, NtrC family, response regulator HydG